MATDHRRWKRNFISKIEKHFGELPEEYLVQTNKLNEIKEFEPWRKIKDIEKLKWLIVPFDEKVKERFLEFNRK